MPKIFQKNSGSVTLVFGNTADFRKRGNRRFGYRYLVCESLVTCRPGSVKMASEMPKRKQLWNRLGDFSRDRSRAISSSDLAEPENPPPGRAGRPERNAPLHGR
jgi:hypothetical protein